ncbi:hypothetical protein ACHQM5_005871 [Ranunculus cassubicifolius]
MDERGGNTNGLGKSCILVIVVAAVERFAFKGVASNLVTYLTEVVELSNSTAAKSVNTWCGVSFLLPLLGALLADSVLDRYSIIVASSLLYVLGLVALTSTAFLWQLMPSSKSNCYFLLLSLLLISLGQGGYNPCLQAFGAEQINIDEELPSNKQDPISAKNKSSFFKWWYFGICGGSLLGVSCLSYLQDTFGWGLGFAIPTVAMAVSVFPFSCGNRYYKHREQRGGRDKRTQKVIQAIKTSVAKILNGKIILSAKESVVDEVELEEKPLCKQNFEFSENLAVEPDTVISDMKAVLRLLPIWTMLLMFAVIFQQPATFFTKQGMTMKRNIGNNFLIPPATLQSAINISVLLLMPSYDSIVIPIVRVFTRNDKGITVTQRMGIGMFLSIIAMAFAAYVERKRLESNIIEGTVQLSIFWLLPQYILLGMSDVFTVVGMQEFFYTEVPSGMKTVGMALHLSVFGVGSFLSALMIEVIEYFTSEGTGNHGWFSDDMSAVRLDKFYSLLAVLSVVSLMLFIHLCKRYSRSNA